MYQVGETIMINPNPDENDLIQCPFDISTRCKMDEGCKDCETRGEALQVWDNLQNDTKHDVKTRQHEELMIELQKRIENLEESNRAMSERMLPYLNVGKGGVDE